MELRLDEVAALVGGTLVVGDGDKRVSGVATLEQAGASDLSFFGVAKYRPQFDATRAGAVLVPPDVTSGPDGVALIRVENPSLALGLLAQKAAEAARAFEPGIDAGAHVAEGAQVDPAAGIRPGAVIEAGAVVGAGTEVRSGAVVGRGARVGRDCVIYQNVTIREGCVVGDRVILQPGAVIGADGFGYQYAEGRHQKIPQLGIVVLEDDVEIGANTCVDRARFGKTVVGQGTKIDNLVQIAHNVEIGKHCLLVSLSGVAGSTKLADHVTVAAQVGIAGHIEIASGVTLAGRTGVARSITEPGEYIGTPAKPVKEEVRIWRGLSKLHEMGQELRALRKEVEDLKARQ